MEIFDQLTKSVCGSVNGWFAHPIQKQFKINNALKDSDLFNELIFFRHVNHAVSSEKESLNFIKIIAS